MSDTDKTIEQVLAEAERIRAGDKQAAPPEPPTSGGAASEGEGGSSPSPLSDFSTLANLCVVIGDVACTRFFGSVGQLQEPLRTEAVKAWAAVIAQYAPLIGQAGPWGALLSVYGVHLVSCAMVTSWTPAPSPESSADVEAEKPRF